MKIQLFSDNHSNWDKIKISQECDIVIHTGDFTHGIGDSSTQILKFVELCNKTNKPYILVLGNHDQYGYTFNETIYDWMYKNNINYLTRGLSYEFMEYTFIGDTLFTDFYLPGYSNLVLERPNYYISDFNYIYRKDNTLITPLDYIDEYNKTLEWFENFRNKDNIIVCTHFVPTMKLIQPQYEGNQLNPYFINNINLKGFKTWLCGHTHCTDHVIDNECNVHVNAYGYTNGIIWECPNFNPDYIITV